MRKKAEPLKFSQAFYIHAWHFGWQWLASSVSVTASLIARKPAAFGTAEEISLCVHPSVVVPRQITLAVATGEILIGLFCQHFFGGDRPPVSLPQSNDKSFNRSEISWPLRRAAWHLFHVFCSTGTSGSLPILSSNIFQTVLKAQINK